MSRRDASGLHGKTAVITGAASGIGAALARELARLGAEVVLADRQLDLARDVANEVRALGGRATASDLDVRDPSALTRIVDDTLTRSGAIDFFFNNAGIGVG